MGWIRSNQPDDRPRQPAERLTTISPGVPGRCPACDGLGYIDNIDLGHRYQIQHCKDCGHRWEYLFDRDGAVVGLTELDDRGQPQSRTRVRPLRAPAPVPEAAVELVEAPDLTEEPDLAAETEPAEASEEAELAADADLTGEPDLVEAIELVEAIGEAATEEVGSADAAPVPSPSVPAPEPGQGTTVSATEEVIDLREPAASPAPPEEMSPAEWLRHAAGR